jgi:hypothetical protein
MPDAPTPIPTAAQLGTRVGKTSPNAEVEHALNVAIDMVNTAIEQAFRPVPPYIVQECILSAGHALYDRTKGSGGVAQLTNVEGQPAVRAPRDPKATIRHILSDYVLGFA